MQVKQLISKGKKTDRGSMLLKIRKRFLKDWQLYILLLPAIVYLFLFNYMPIYGVQIAFRDYSLKLGIWGSEWVGLQYFKQFINYPSFKLLLRNTLEIGIYSLLTFPCDVIFALMLNEVRCTKFKKSVQMISYMPYFLSTVVVCSMLKLFFDRSSGIVNAFIEILGGNRIDFLTEPSMFADLFVWSGTWQNLGFGAIIYIAALSGVPAELIEAAKIDGAKRLRIIWHVNLPCIIPTIVIMLILSCGGIVSVGSEKTLLLQNALNLSRSQVISTYTYQVGLKGGQYSYASAIGLFNNLISLTLVIIVNKISQKVGETSLW